MKFDLSKIAKAAALGVAATAGLASRADAAVVINEVYSGGGNAGAPLNADFVELFNNGLSTESLGGLVLAYGAATGYFATNTFTIFTLPTFTLLPGQSYLISGATGANGVALTGVDLVTVLNAGTAGGKVGLFNGTSTVDLVGYGTATATPTSAPAAGFSGPGFETAPAATSGNLLSLTRAAGLDTGNNSTDFVAATPSPTGSAVPEPTSLGLAAAGALLIGRRRR